jgi:hypothetical protein
MSMSNEQDKQEYLEAVIVANMEHIEKSIRRGQEQLASGEPVKSLDEIVDDLGSNT